MKKILAISITALTLSACGSNIQWCHETGVSCAPATSSSSAMDDLQKTIENNRNWDKTHCGHGSCNHLGGYVHD